MRLGKLLNLFAQLRVSADPGLFHLANFGINAFERILQRLDQFVDCFLLKLEIAFRALKEFLDSLGGIRTRCLNHDQHVTWKLSTWCLR